MTAGESVLVAIIVGGVGAMFARCCCAIVRAAYADVLRRSDVLLTFYRAAAFALGVVGCLALTDLCGNAVSAAFSVACCAGSWALGARLEKGWRAGEAADDQAVLELRVLVDRYRDGGASAEDRIARAAREHNLTRREEEVLALLLAGRTRPEIARELIVSADTVKTHIRNLYRKMGVAGKDELARAMLLEA